MDVRYLFVKQHIDCGDLKIEHLPTDDMTADFLTKALVGHQFYKLRAKLMNHHENISTHPKHNGPKANLTSLTPFNSKECVGDHGAQERTLRTHHLQKVKRSTPLIESTAAAPPLTVSTAAARHRLERAPLRESETVAKSRYVSDSPPFKR